MKKGKLEEAGVPFIVALGRTLLNSPNNAPTARLAFSGSSWLTAAKALKISGAPLPSANSVTPATF